MKKALNIFVLLSCLLLSNGLEAQSLTDGLSAYAIITTKDETVLSAEMDGRLKAIPFQEGERFKAGDVLAAFSCESVEAEQSAVEAMHRAASAQLKNATRLDKVGAAGALDLELARSALEEAVARGKMVSSKFAKCNIVAPFDGVLLSMNVVEYESVKNMTPLLRIGREGAFRVKVIAPAAWLGWLKTGVDFEFTPHGVERSYSGYIDKIGASVDPASQTIKVEGEIKGDALGLRSGMGGTIKAFNGEKANDQ